MLAAHRHDPTQRDLLRPERPAQGREASSGGVLVDGTEEREGEMQVVAVEVAAALGRRWHEPVKPVERRHLQRDEPVGAHACYTEKLLQRLQVLDEVHQLARRQRLRQAFRHGRSRQHVAAVHVGQRHGAQTAVGQAQRQLLTCPRCNGRRRLLAFITDPQAITRILAHLGLPTELPAIAPARAPPRSALPFA